MSAAALACTRVEGQLIAACEPRELQRLAPPSSSMVGRARLKDEADLKCYIILERINLGLRHLTDGLSIGLLRRDESKGRASCGGEQESRGDGVPSRFSLGPSGNSSADELHISVRRLTAHGPPPPQCCTCTVHSKTSPKLPPRLDRARPKDGPIASYPQAHASASYTAS